MEILGIDFGGSGIKGAPVNIETASMLTERYRIDTPIVSTPAVCIDIIAEIAKKFNWNGKIGIGYPGVVQNGIAKTAANVDKGWIDFDIQNAILNKLGCKSIALNDADAAGTAEVLYGAGKGVKGLVLVLTVGTGIGSALFTNGKLVPNTELGHIIYKDKEAEKYCSDKTRKDEGLEWEDWAKRFSKYVNYLDSLFWPDLVIIGGGVSKKEDKIGKLINIKPKFNFAQLKNEAGIIGAALAAKDL